MGSKKIPGRYCLVGHLIDRNRHNERSHPPENQKESRILIEVKSMPLNHNTLLTWQEISKRDIDILTHTIPLETDAAVKALCHVQIELNRRVIAVIDDLLKFYENAEVAEKICGPSGIPP